jgi:hypothetical protein
LLREIGNELNPKDKTGATYRESAIRMLWHKVANEGSIRGAELIAEREEGKVTAADRHEWQHGNNGARGARVTNSGKIGSA